MALSATNQKKVDSANKIMDDNLEELQLQVEFFESAAGSEASYDNVMLRLQILDELQKSHQVQRNKLRDLDLGQVIDDNAKQKFRQFNDIYITLCSKLKRETRKYEEARIPKTSTSDANSTFKNKPSGVKVKPLEPPEFNGSVENWIQFRDVFEAVINKNDTLDDIQKFHYLRISMKLPAGQANIIDSFAFTADNYKEAWKAIKKRYNDKRKIIGAHLTALYTAKKMVNNSSIELRKIIDTFTSNLSALKQQNYVLNDADDIANIMIVHLVEHRLDDETLRDWKKFHKEDTATWCQLYDFLEALQRSLDDNRFTKTKPAEQKRFVKHSVSNYVDDRSNAVQTSCCLCSGSHPLWSCPKFISLTPQERFNIVKEKSMCINCLSMGHLVTNCKSSFRCKSCGKLHHSLLHFENKFGNSSTADSFTRAHSSTSHKFGNSSTADSFTRANSSTSHEPSAEDSHIQDFRPTNWTKKSLSNEASNASHNSVNSITMLTQRQILLPTIRLGIADSQGNYRMCRALLDTGSDANLMQTSLAKELNLTLRNFDSMLHGVNGHRIQIDFKTTATIRSCQEEYTKELDFTVLDDVTSCIPTASININRFNIPAECQLADPTFNKSQQIDLLLSSEVFYDCLLDQQIRLPDGPVLSKTLFGWVVAGTIPSFAHCAISRTVLVSMPVQRNKAIPDIDSKLDKFIESEDIPSTRKSLTSEKSFPYSIAKCSIYVENLLGGHSNLAKDQRLFLQVRYSPSQVGIKSFKFVANNSSLLQKLPTPDVQPTDDDRRTLQSLTIKYDALRNEFSYKGRSQLSVLIAKSKVAPANQQTLARLELCSATLLVKLITRTISTLSVSISKVVLWSDSTIVLAWITIHPLKLSTFVGNRVAVITELTNKFTWQHIKGSDNPADIISRGLNPTEIKENSLWWNGPSFYQLPQHHWPDPCITINAEDPAVKVEMKRSLVVRPAEHFLKFIENRISKYPIIIRMFATANRFIAIKMKSTTARIQSPFTLEELHDSEIIVTRIVQRNFFSEEYKFLKKQNDLNVIDEQRRHSMFVNKHSSLISLSHWMDNDGLIRTRKRISNCPASIQHQKQQILLRCYKISNRIRRLHQTTFDSETAASLFIVHQIYWHIHAKVKMKKFSFAHFVDFRAKQRSPEQIKSEYLSAIVTKTQSFVKFAVDLAGLIMINSCTSRSAPSDKVFVFRWKCSRSIPVKQQLSIATAFSSQILLDPSLEKDIVKKTSSANRYLVLVSERQNNLVFFKLDRLQSWDRVQQQTQMFWNLWYRDYLHTLQQRPVKFRVKNEYLVGDMVLLMKKDLPSLKWLLVRITKIFPSKRDHVVRNVEVKTQFGFQQLDVRCLAFISFEDQIKDDQKDSAINSFPPGACLRQQTEDFNQFTTRNCQ